MSAQKVDVLAVMPLHDEEAPDEVLTAWIDGDVKPHHEGPYVREFDEGEGLSWWYEGQWHMDSFFAGPSGIQNAPWRGIDSAALASIVGDV